jgi:hypothetical protein
MNDITNQRIFVGNYATSGPQKYNYLVATDEYGKIYEVCNLPTEIFKPAFLVGLQRYINEGKHLEQDS